MIPESRKDDGLMLRRPVRENVSLSSLRSLGRFGFVRRRPESAGVRDALTSVAATSAPRHAAGRSCPAATSRS